MKADIRIDDRAVRAALNRLAALGRDLSPAMREIAGALEAGVEDAFQGERSPDGSPWAPLSPVTQARRAARRKWPGRILQDSADLAGSIHSRHGPLHAVAGTNLPYAPTHQFGARRGQYGRTRRGGPIPWGDIPARPFLGASEATRRGIARALNRRVRDAWRGR